MKLPKGSLKYIILGGVVLVSIGIYYIGQPKPEGSSNVVNPTIPITIGGTSSTVQDVPKVEPEKSPEKSVDTSSNGVKITKLVGVPALEDYKDIQVKLEAIENLRLGEQIIQVGIIQLDGKKFNLVIPSFVDYAVGDFVHVKYGEYSKAGLCRVELDYEKMEGDQ